MIQRNQVKVTKRHEWIFDKLNKDGFVKVDRYSDWLYMARIRKHTKSVELHPLDRQNKFLITPTKKLSKNKKKSMGGRYAYYEII